MISIERFCASPMGVFGEVMENGHHIAYSIEQPWNDNIPFHSCIPAGQYSLVNHDGTKYKNTFVFFAPELDVHLSKHDTGRYACVMHPANRAQELSGCMAFGASLSCLNGEWAVSRSRDTTYNVIEKLRKTKQHGIIISWRIP